MSIKFVENLIDKTNGLEMFNSLFYQDSEGVDCAFCENISHDECMEDLFWKDLVCGRSQGSPCIGIFVRATEEYKNNYNIEEAGFFEYQVILNVVRKIFKLDKTVSIGREYCIYNDVPFLDISHIYLGQDPTKDIDKSKGPDVVTASLLNQGALDRIAIFIPYSLILLDTNWGRISESFDIDSAKKIILYRLNGVFN